MKIDNGNLEVFHFDTNKPNFESFAIENGIKTWYARDLMFMLGYKDYNTFRNGAIKKAIQACLSLNIPLEESFIQTTREIESKNVADYKLTRFACYLIAMNGDVKIKQVANAQAFFVKLAEAFKEYFQERNNIERVILRDEISERERTLSGVVKNAGIEFYGLFQNAGYRGMYNMNLRDLKQFKGVKDNMSLLDFMGKTELAANLFRITQTEDKIKNDNINGQKNLEDTAENVGKEVRNTILKIKGTAPEYLLTEENIKNVKSKLKTTNKEFKKLDQKKKKK